MSDYPSNFARVDTRLMRGARPTPAHAKNLFEIGVRTVINMEWERSDIDIFSGLDVNLVRIKDFEPLPWIWPSMAMDHIALALTAIKKGPSFSYVHCRSGQNRTGVVIAAYRLFVLDQPLSFVLNDFRSYRGLWAWGDSIFIESLTRNADLWKLYTLKTT
jgi:hypothetical protein